MMRGAGEPARLDGSICTDQRRDACEPLAVAMRKQFMLKLLCALGFALLAGSIMWAFGRAPFWPSVAEITANPWGVVTLVDLYLGFFIFGIVLWRFEPNRLVAGVLIAAMPVLGNVVPLAWLVWRGLDLVRPAR
jgi:hypothetical protein